MLEKEILDRLTTKTFGRHIHSFDSIDSTNTFAKTIAGTAEEGTLVIAEKQTAGRGRLGRAWYSEQEKNLTFSIIIKPDMAVDFLGVLSLYAAVAVADAIHATTHCIAHCKWPNDLLLGGRKCCGILCESNIVSGTASFVTIGIGLNVNQTNFPDEIRAAATSLSLEAGRIFDRTYILVSVLLKLEEWYHIVSRREYDRIIGAWESRAPMLGKSILIRQHEDMIEGIATGLDARGSLLLHSGGLEHTLVAGDVSIMNEFPP